MTVHTRAKQVLVTGAVSFVLLSVIGAISGGSLPGPDSSYVTIATYYADHRSAALTASFFFALSTLALLVFAAALAVAVRGNRQAESPPGEVGWAMVAAFAGAVTVAALILIATAATATLAYRIGPTGQPVVVGLYDLSNFLTVFASFGAALFAGGVAAVIMVGGGAPPWLGPLSVLAALVELVSTLGVFARSGAFAPGGGATYVAFAVFIIWVLAVAFGIGTDIGGFSSPGPVPGGPGAWGPPGWGPPGWGPPGGPGGGPAPGWGPPPGAQPPAGWPPAGPPQAGWPPAAPPA